MEHAPTVADPALVARHIENLVPFWGQKMVADIKGASCRAFANKRTPAMARRSLETLRAAINYFHKEYGLDPVPAFTMPTKPKRRERWLTRTEAARMLWQARRTPHLARFILIGLYTGTRSGAILGLLWMPSTTGGWIDVDRGVLHRASADKRETKKRQPPAKMPDRLLAHARRWRRMDGDLRHVVQWNGAPVASIKKAFRSARTAAGLDAKVIPHSLRHTCATWLMQGGAEAWDAAGYLGMTVEMLDRTYGHHSPTHQQGAMDALNRRA